MAVKVIQFTAASVECSEAVDWQYVQVTFDSMDAGFDEDNRVSPYLMISVDLDFEDQITVEFHDGEDYDGDSLSRIDLWRHRVHALSGDGYEFDIAFELSDDAFAELRKYLRVIMRSDCFRE
ncbi:hypothetical protein [Haloferula sp.]|uniref:hypothetical protein n=1 Tax=Haloferula sp. TaxID=2497595 RepID=UPI003C70F9C3